jgi:hypothetical protein
MSVFMSVSHHGFLASMSCCHTLALDLENALWILNYILVKYPSEHIF